MFCKDRQLFKKTPIALSVMVSIGMMATPVTTYAELISKATENGCEITASKMEVVPGEEFTLHMTAFGEKANLGIVENAGFLGSIVNSIGDLPASLTVLAPNISTDYTFYVWREDGESVYGGCEVAVSVTPVTYDDSYPNPMCLLNIEKNSAQDLPVEIGDELRLRWYAENAVSAQLRLSPARVLGVVEPEAVLDGSLLVPHRKETNYSLEVWNENGQMSICTANADNIEVRPVPAINEAVFVTTSGDDTGIGNQTDPFLTIQHGIDVVVADDQLSQVLVAAGTYSEQITLTPSAKNVSLFGGFDENNWSHQDPIAHPTSIISDKSWALKQEAKGEGVVHGLSLIAKAPSVTAQMIPPVSVTAVYVSLTGSDSATGTSVDPLRTIQKGVDVAAANSALEQVWVSAGTYNENIVIDQQASGVSLFGGYDQNNWNNRGFSTYETIIESLSEWVIHVSDYHRDGVIEGFTVRTAPQTITENSTRAIILEDITGHLYIQNNLIEAGFGEDGADGGAGTSGLNGENGLAGNVGYGGNGGRSGGSCGFAKGGLGVIDGVPHQASPGTGTAGASGSAPLLQANGWVNHNTIDWVALNGEFGGNGDCGVSGDGGTGGICLFPNPFAPVAITGGGGGGGAGSGGTGASPGFGGGGSIGILAIRSNRVWLYNNTIKTKDGGEGGDGALGGVGGTKGVGADGAVCYVPGWAGAGFRGADGGNGGKGGDSSGGAGGISAGIVRVDSIDLVNPPGADPNSNFITVGGGGFGGKGAGGASDGLDNQHHYDYEMK